MTQVVTLTLDQINCILEEDNPSTPYLWTAFVWIDENTGDVSVPLTPPESDDRVVLASNLQPGQSAQIPSAVGVATQSFDNLGKAAFIQVTVLWQKHSTPANAVEAGFKAFGKNLQSAIQDNILQLNDPQTQQQATDKVEKTVAEAVAITIWDNLTTWEKAEVVVGTLTPDSAIATGQQAFRNMQSQQFTMALGDPSDGRLLFYLYGNEDGTGNVAGPSTIGDSGWNAFKFLFSPGEGIIYAVDHEGDLLFYRDHNQDGTGNVADPSTIGDGGWGDFKFLFSGGNGIIYAVNPQGQLLFYRDHNQDGTGNVADPTVIGASGFDAYKFLFSGGGKGIIYAAEVGPTHYYTIPGTFQITTS